MKDDNLLETIARTVAENATKLDSLGQDVTELKDDMKEVKAGMLHLAEVDRLRDRLRVVETRLGIDPLPPIEVEHR